ncbi:MAG: DUF4279 domain-containing protein [Crocinitomicaceae bacterium]|nr:DUF4279 domain-containing protein [Crocinitomicaceae bacterium]
MTEPNSYAYFKFSGDFNPDLITETLGIQPSEIGQKGEQGKYIKELKQSYWKLKSSDSKEKIFIEKMVEEVVSKLKSKAKIISELKSKYQLNSVLEIVLYVDTNEEESTPALGHSSEVIAFLYETGTVTDVDIYRYNSKEY